MCVYGVKMVGWGGGMCLCGVKCVGGVGCGGGGGDRTFCLTELFSSKRLVNFREYILLRITLVKFSIDFSLCCDMIGFISRNYYC
jgi:hypothetical protein